MVRTQKRNHSIKMIDRVFNKIKTHPPGGHSAEVLTGLSSNVINRIKSNETIDAKKFTPDRMNILKVLSTNIIENNTLLTTLQLFEACGEYVPAYMDISTFRKLLFKYDFVWKKIEDSSFVVLERPEVTYERYNYLKTIKDYFDDRDIYFIEENAYFDSEPQPYFTYADSLEVEGSTKKVIYAVSSNKIIFNENFEADYTHDAFKQWITCELIPNLDKPSVVVYNAEEHHSETSPAHSNVTINSLRYEMTEWLDANNIPYDDTMAKVELFSLIEHYTNAEANPYVVDNILLSYGHIPLRIPNHIMNLTPGMFTYNTLNEALKDPNITTKVEDEKYPEVRKLISHVLSNISNECLKNWFELVFEQYGEILENDMKVDNRLDSLLAKPQLVKYEDSDVPSLSEDSD